MEYALTALHRRLPDVIVDMIVRFEPDSHWHEKQRKPSNLTVWLKHAVRREIEHGTSRLIKRVLPWIPVSIRRERGASQQFAVLAEIADVSSKAGSVPLEQQVEEYNDEEEEI
jgi:hypothetical protein